MANQILLYNGRLVDPFNLQPADFCLESIAHSLSLLNRYTGHTRVPYSVAQHSLTLSHVVPEHLQRAAIIHDMNEALTNDLPRPLKSRLGQFVEFEEMVQRRLFEMLNEPWKNMEDLAKYDLHICADEMLALMNYSSPSITRLGVEIPYHEPWFVVKRDFIDRAIKLGVPEYVV